MTVNTQTSDDQQTQVQYFRQFLFWSVIAAVIILIAMLLALLNQLSWPVLCLVLVVGLNVIVGFLAYVYVERLPLHVISTTITLLLWFTVLVVVLVSPQSFPALVGVIIMSVVVALPYVSNRLLQLLTGGAFLVSVTVGVLSRGEGLVKLANIPTWALPVIAMVGTPLFTLVTLGLLRQYKVRLTVALATSRAANTALQESERNLEVKVLDRTQELAQARDEAQTANKFLQAANSQIGQLNVQLQSENLRLKAEVEVTRRLQQMILPREQELKAVRGLEIAGYMQPADEVGGDYYDVLQQDGRVKIGIGDVTGHGLESGVLMLMVQTAVRTLLASEEDDPVRFLNVLNRAIYDNVQRMGSDKNLTLSLLDYQDGYICLTGQHEAPLIVRVDGTIEVVDTLNLGFPVGLVDDVTTFSAQTNLTLRPGDLLVLYTDGIPEASNLAGQQYGIERLGAVVKHTRSESALLIKQAVIDDLLAFIGTETIFDDITLLILKQKQL